MNLAIDVGNSLIKIGLFNSDQLLLKKVSLKEEFITTLKTLKENYPNIQNIIVASVGKLSDDQIEYLNQEESVVYLTQKTPVPFKNRYASPKTLGVDRIALVAAAASQFKRKNVLIIDVGTCITYDFINNKNEYLGGGISPGILMRYKSVNNYTSNLPLLEPKEMNSIIGITTTHSLHSGILIGVQFEIDGFIEAYKELFSSLTVILTGGDVQFLRDSLKNDIFANPNFLLEGLNHILDYNTH